MATSLAAPGATPLGKTTAPSASAASSLSPPNSFLLGKTAPPSVPTGYLPRPRLDRQWEDWEALRLVLIEAAASYGKTTVLAGNVVRSGRRVFWYTFDSLDSGLDSLAAQMCSVLAPARGASGGTTSPTDAPDSPIATATMSPAFLSLLLHHIRLAREGWNLVLDDLHRARMTPDLASFLENLARCLPAGSTLFLASREPIGIQASKLRLLRQAVTVGAQDLQFTLEETTALFRGRIPDRPPERADLERIAAKTEGWAAGLGICLQYIERAPGRSLKHALDRMDAAGRRTSGHPAPGRGGPGHDDPDWFSYFAEEILASLDPLLQRFLVRAAALPRMTPALCDQVLGIRNSRALLVELDRRNLFTFPVASTAQALRDAPATATALRPSLPGESAYRFHQLFQDFLERRLRDTVPESEIRALRRRAARVLALDGAAAEAALLFADAGDTRSALRILETHGASLLAAGQAGVLLRAFAALRPRDYADRPRALFILGRVHEALGRWNEAEALYTKALQTATPRSTNHAPAALRLELVRLLAQIQIHRGRYAEAARLIRKALAASSRIDPASRARFVFLLGTCAAEAGKCDEAERHLVQAGESFARSRDALGEAQVHYLLGTCVHHPRGDLFAAQSAVRRALEYFRDAKDLQRICQSRGVLAFFAIEDGEERIARELAEEALRQAESFGLRGVEGYARLTLGRCALLRARMGRPCAGGSNDRTEAGAHFTEALAIGEAIEDTDLAIYPRLGLGEIARDNTNLDAARRHASAALAFARHAGIRLGEAQACVLLGSCERAHRPGASRAWWRKAEALLRALGATRPLHRLLLLRLHAGDVPQWRIPAVLEELLRGVARMRHESLLLVEEREAGAAALGAALRMGVAREYAASLLLRLGEDAIPELRKGLAERTSGAARDRAARAGAGKGAKALRPRRAAGPAPYASRAAGTVRDAPRGGAAHARDPNAVAGNPASTDLAALCADLIARIGGDAARAAFAGMKNPSTKVGRLARRAWAESERLPEAPLRIRALGPLRVSAGEREVPADAWTLKRTLWLFLFLLIRRCRWVAREEIIDAFWPEEDPENARHNLRQSVHLLRKVLEPNLPAGRPTRYLPASRDAVKLEPGAHWTYDVAQFEEGLTEAQETAAGEKGALRAAERLRKTLALYRGDFVEAYPSEPFMQRERDRLRDGWSRGTSRLLALLGSARAWEEVIPIARAALARDPHREEFHFHLITAHLESGNRGKALAAYRRYEEIVHRDLGLLPSRNLLALAERITEKGTSRS